MKMHQTVSIVALSCFLLFAATKVDSLEVGYYKCQNTCPEAEDISKAIVYEYVMKDMGIGAGLIRLFFHDCFVRGCDASVLIDPTPANPNPEKLAVANLGLRGFDVIDKIKETVETFCPGVVSCADIIAFAARDASDILGGITYDVAAGRLDGKVSNETEAQQTLPDHAMDLTELKDAFSAKGLDTEDLVVLSGAHTIGRSHCSNINPRLYPNIDPTMDTGFAYVLMNQCPEYAYDDGVVDLDYETPNQLDSQYYKNLLDLKVVFFSDWSLLTTNETKNLVIEYATQPGDWEADFAVSMVNLGNLTSAEEGEIRTSCRAVN